MFDYHQIIYKRKQNKEKYELIGLFWACVGLYGYCCLLKMLGV